MELLDAKDVRRVLKVSLPLVYKLAEQGRLPCVRIPCPGKGTERTRTIVRFKPEDVFSFVEKHYRAG
ncbi:MAG: helix-turn-helix domain-containing protein [Deltaproteobacteria bacterium]|nr:helix-turn-helix domain-containing protein [Deltaproteobacteria bacterium]